MPYYIMFYRFRDKNNKYWLYFSDTIRTVESRGARKLVELVSLSCTVVACRTAGADRLAGKVGIGPSWTGHWACTTLWAVMS